MDKSRKSPVEGTAVQSVLQHRWHYLYFALSGLVLFTVSMSLYVTHQLIDSHTESVAVNQTWAERLERYTELGELASTINAPGNNVFDTGDAASESARLNEQLIIFDNKLAGAFQDLQKNVEPQQAQPLLRDLNSIDQAMKLMVAEAEQIFSYFRDGQRERAGDRMAVMDRRYADITGAIAQMSYDVREIQFTHFAEQGRVAALLSKFEYVIAGLIVLMISGISTYGYKLSQSINAASQERDKLLAAAFESEVHLHRIIDGAADGIITINEQGIIESYNRAAEKLFWYAAGEIVGCNIRKLMPSPSRDQHDGYLQSYHEGGPKKVIGVRREVIGQRKDGSTFPLDIHVSELKLGEQRVFTGIVRDVTERKKAEENLRESEERFRDLFDSANDVILSVDKDGNILMINHRAEELTGFTHEELTRSNVLRDLLLPEDEARVMDIISTLKRNESVFSEVRWKTKDGNVIVFETSSSPRFSAEGEFLYSRCILRDITERKKAEKLLQRAKDELEDRVIERTAQLLQAKQAAESANQSKSEFLANMSHEIRTPLHGILSFAQFGMKKALTADPQKLFDYFEKIDTSGQRLLVLLSDILDLAKMETGHLRYEFKSTDLPPILRSLQNEYRSLLADRNITIDYVETNVEFRLTLDGNRIAQVVRNLLSNAAKFSPDGGAVWIEINEGDEEVQISIRDQGMGVPEDELELIFDKFAQSSKTRTGAGGTGLGLSICREIVEAHQGRIWCENHPQGGAVFHFVLPRTMQVNHSGDQAESGGLNNTEEDTEQTAAVGISKRCI